MLLFGTGVVCGVALAGLYAVYKESPTLDAYHAKRVVFESYRDASAAHCEALKNGFGSGTTWNNWLAKRELFLAEWREDEAA